MIVPMKKVCLVVQEQSQNKALTKLREIGVIHLEKTNTTSESLAKAFERKARAEDALGLIFTYKAPKAPKKKKSADSDGRERRAPLAIGERRGRRATDKMGVEENEPYSLDAVNAPKRPDLIDYMMDLHKDHKVLEDRLAILARERDRIAAWGEYDPQAVKDMASLGIPVFLCECNEGALASIPREAQYIKLSEDETGIRLMALYKEIHGIAQFRLPETSLSRIQAELDEVTAKWDELNSRFKSFADRRPTLAKEMATIHENIDFEVAKTELKKIEGTANYGISLLKGYVPAVELGRLKAAAAENGWALTAYDPAPDDIPPTLLKTNRVAGILKPLLSFLGTVPGYREFDISPSYLLFFGLFFAMIFGDAAYGCIIILISGLLGIGYLKKSGKLPDILKLFLLLGCCTVAWGSINGTWFAIPTEHLPGFLTALIIPQFNGVGPVEEFPAFMQSIFNLPEKIPTDELKTRWNVQFLCFAVALIQLIYARGKRVIRLLPSLSAIAQIGWMVMMFGLYFMVMFLLLRVALPDFVLPLIATGIVLNVIFAEQNGGNFFKNIGKGFAGLFQLVLKTISGFADIISYIRLFAVGFAGTMIAQIFNNMALGSGLGEFGIVFFLRLLAAVMILCLGHVLNLALTSLSVLVHGVRLNLLEYAGNHLEMEWSGYAYDPFALKQKKE